MVVILHGGPHGCIPRDMWSGVRLLLLSQGISVLLPDFRGSTSYGKDFLDDLVGSIGINDVADCGDLTKAALAQYGDIIDST